MVSQEKAVCHVYAGIGGLKGWLTHFQCLFKPPLENEFQKYRRKSLKVSVEGIAKDAEKLL